MKWGVSGLRVWIDVYRVLFILLVLGGKNLNDIIVLFVRLV